MSLPTSTKTWILAEPPAGEIQPSTFKLETRPIPGLKDGELLIKTLTFSNDPAQRGWMDPSIDDRRRYAPKMDKGQPVRATLIGEVIASKSEKYRKGTRVVTSGGWSEYNVRGAGTITSEAV